MNKPADSLERQSMPDDPRCKIKTKQYEVVGCWPHCTDAFTEGLEIHNGTLYESTGGDKNDTPLSTLRRLKLRTGEVLDNIPVNENYFAEGLTIFDGKIFQLTEKSYVGLIYNLTNLGKPAVTFDYNGWRTGWGITNDRKDLIISDSTSQLHFVDPNSFTVKRSIPVHYGDGRPRDWLNELEYVEDSIYANVFLESYIVRIDPQTGEIRDQIDLSALQEPNCVTCYLNGIAYDQLSKHLFVTGKTWSKLFEIRLIGESA